jgi:hypothetical protein
MTAAVVAEGIAVLLLGALMFNLLRTQAKVLQVLGDTTNRRSTPPAPVAGPPRQARPSRAGQRATDVAGVDATGAPAAFGFVEDPVAVLLFLTTSCSTCQQFWAALGAPGETGAAGAKDAASETLRLPGTPPISDAPRLPGTARLPGTPRVVIATPGAALESRSRVRELAPPAVPLVMSADAWKDYEVTGSPFAVVIRHGIVAAEGPVVAWENLVELLE